MWRLKNHTIEDFEILPNNRHGGHLCSGCWFYETETDCTNEEMQPFLNQLFAQRTETEGSCRNHIAKLKTKEDGKEKIALHGEGSN